MKAILDFKEINVTKGDWEDAECYCCGRGWWNKDDNTIDGYRFQRNQKAYCVELGKQGYIQLCKECFDKLEKPDVKR